jgi:hypothetical protein
MQQATHQQYSLKRNKSAMREEFLADLAPMVIHLKCNTQKTEAYTAIDITAHFV